METVSLLVVVAFVVRDRTERCVEGLVDRAGWSAPEEIDLIVDLLRPTSEPLQTHSVRSPFETVARVRSNPPWELSILTTAPADMGFSPCPAPGHDDHDDASG